ncbi:MAG: hypothetical protein ACKVOG_07555 [Rhodoglobus sp.]
MTTLRNRVTAPLTILAALAITLALSGCFGNPIESIIEGATGGDVDLGGKSLPDGYPASEVPIIDGEILFGGAIGNAEGKVYNVTVKVADASALDAITAQLEAAGFTSEGAIGGSTADGGTYIATSDKWGVLVVVSKDGQNGFVANYTVTSAEPTQ